MIHLPFINKYPYTSMEAVNIDWLLNEVSKIPVLEATVNQHETRINTLEETAADHEERLTAAEGDIDALEGRMDTAEADIDQLQDDMSSIKDRMTAAEGDIDALEAVVGDSTSGLVKDVSDLQTDVSDIKQDIIDINTKDQAQDNDIDALQLAVDTLEDHMVTANPGGSGVSLNTLQVGSTVYSVSGGGGGGGSSVTPNPAGAATDTLNKVDIDGTIYGIDIPTDITSDPYDPSETYNTGDYVIYNNKFYICKSDNTTGAWDSSKWDEVNIGEQLESLQEQINSIETNIEVSEASFSAPMNTEPSDNDVYFIPTVLQSQNTLTLTPGVYLLEGSVSFNTATYGSRMRALGLYIRDRNNNTNYALGKFVVRGDEPQMITTAANINISRVITVNSSITIGLAMRCYSSSQDNIQVNTPRLSALKLKELT